MSVDIHTPKGSIYSAMKGLKKKPKPKKITLDSNSNLTEVNELLDEIEKSQKSLEVKSI